MASRRGQQQPDDHAFLGHRERVPRDVADEAAANLERLKLKREKERQEARKQKAQKSFSAIASSGFMVSSARRLGRTWVNKMFISQMKSDDDSYQRVLGDGISRLEIQDPKMLFEFEKFLKQEKIPYHEQGDHTYYLENIVDKREKVAQDVLVQKCLGRLWNLVPKNGEGGRHIAKADFVDFHLCLQKVLFVPFDFTEALRRAEDDWAVDVLRPEHTYKVMPTLTDGLAVMASSIDADYMTQRGMSEGQFRPSMFEFADVWTDSVERMDYVRFLSVMLDRISLKKKLSHWEYFDKYAIIAADEPYKGRDANGQDERKWIQFPTNVSTRVEHAFLVRTLSLFVPLCINC